MNILFVKHKVRDGYEKVYRFNADRQSLSFGSSRKADVRLPKAVASAIEGSLQFEKTNGKGAWVYHSFSMKESEPIIVPLNARGQFRIGPHEFSTEVVDQKSLFDEQNESADLGDQLVLLMLNGHIFRSFTVKVGQTLNLDEAGERMTINTRQSRTWISEVQGSFVIRQRTMAKTNAGEMLASFKDSMQMSKQDRMTVGAIVAVFMLGVVAMMLGPKESAPELAAEPPKTMTSPTVVKLTPPKEVKTVAPREAPAKDAGVRRMNNIANLSQSIANRAGKFLKNARMPAAIGPNGTLNAPAMGVSRLDGPTTDWSAAAGESVSGKVAGGLGGNGTNARLSGGSVGQKGVNLLEDESEVAGGLDKEVIADFIRRNIGHILYCYERSLSANPNLFGKVSVRFVIGASGQVETQKIGESTLKEAKVESCILDKVAAWKFPTPKGGVQVMVTYPFLFKTTN